MAITNREAVVPGTFLIATYKKTPYHAQVLADGSIQLGDDNSKSYKSLSTAGVAVTGSAINGWRFWSIDESAEQPKPAKAKRAKAQPKDDAAEKPARAPRKPRTPQVEALAGMTPLGMAAPDVDFGPVVESGDFEIPTGDGSTISVFVPTKEQDE